MKKAPLIIIVIVMTLILSSCSTLLYALEEAQNAELTENTDITVLEESKPISSSQTSDNMPSLPDLDYSNMHLLEDGYEIAEYRTNPDGDTVTFIVDGIPYVTRFLAIDTPEMHYEENNPEPWAQEALTYTENILKNANTIILEIDEESDIFDDYDRLLAWIWVDGELLNYKLVENGLAYVKYLYGDYKYNDILIQLEDEVSAQGIGLWGNDDPAVPQESSSNSSGNNSNTQDTLELLSIEDARNLSIGSKAEITGVITNVVGYSAFIEDGTSGIYIYAKKHYDELAIGNKIQIAGKIADYNGLLELTDIGNKIITVLDSNINVAHFTVNLSEVNESLESQLVKVNDLTITDIVTSSEKGYNIIVTDGNTEGIIRIDRYLSPYPDPSFISIGETIDVIGNVSQHNNSYQIMIGSPDDIIK